MACPPNVVAPGLSARSYTSGRGDRSPPSSENLTRRDPDHAFELAALLAADSLGIGEVPRVGAHDILGFRDRPGDGQSLLTQSLTLVSSPTICPDQYPSMRPAPRAS